MFVVSLTCNPDLTAIRPSLADSLRNAWGGGDVVWLAQSEACEFNVLEKPNNFVSVWNDLQSISCDLNIQTTDNRKKKMLLADMDSTMIQQECIDELAAEAGVGDHVAGITARAMNDEIDFEDALKERVSLLKGLDVAIIDKVFQNRITFMPGGKTLLTTMKANGAHAGLVSGGFTDFTARVADQLGFDENRANTLLAKDGKLTGEVGMPILGRDAKVQALNEITARIGISTDDVMAVGDGANDLGMLGAAGAGVALHAKPTVQAQAQLKINHGDLTALLYLQGYAKSEFIT